MFRIKEIAKSKGITLTEIAEKLGTTLIGLNKSLNNNPTFKRLCEIAHVLGVDVRDLIEPTKATTQVELFCKDDKGGFVSVGFIDMNKTSSDT